MRSSSAALLALAVMSACSGGADTSSPRLVLLYATCTLNRAYLGAYAEDVTYTPHLDQFAEESVVFRRHQTESGQSGISFASIFSGTQSDRHGVFTHPNRLPDELYLITEAFSEAGYDTYFWSGHEMATYDLNYGQGVRPENVFHPERPGKREKKWSFLQSNDALFQKLLSRLEADPEYRAFVQVNFSVTHGLYDRQIPAERYGAFLREFSDHSGGLSTTDLERAWKIYREHRFDLQWDFPKALADIGFDRDELEAFKLALEVTYKADVATLDTMFGSTLALLRSRGLLESSLIAFTADHGETFCRDETLFHWTHGLQLAPEVLEVPWILRAPQFASAGFEPGSYDKVTRSIDVFPTLAGLCGIDLTSRGIAGADLSPVLLGKIDAPALLAYSHTTTIGTHHIDEFRSWGVASRFFGTTAPEAMWVRIRDGDLVYKWRNLDGTRWGCQVFDLASDPFERDDLFDDERAEHLSMRERLRDYHAHLVERFHAATVDVPSDAEDRLKALGYVE